MKKNAYSTVELEDWSRSGLKLLGLAYKDDLDPHELVGYNWVGLSGY